MCVWGGGVLCGCVARYGAMILLFVVVFGITPIEFRTTPTSSLNGHVLVKTVRDFGDQFMVSVLILYLASHWLNCRGPRMSFR